MDMIAHGLSDGKELNESDEIRQKASDVWLLLESNAPKEDIERVAN